MDQPKPFLSTSMAVVLGAVIISISILVSGGIIKIGKPGNNVAGVQAPAAVQGVGVPQSVKTEADIVRELKSQAQNLGLDQNKFNSCLDSGEKASVVSKDLSDGSSAGVNGTPAFFINGRLLSGAVPFEQFKTIIEEELAGTTAVTVTRAEVGAGDLPAQGNINAKVVLVEFSDYQCPFCERHFTQTEGKLKKDYIDTGKVKFYYRDFPLSQIHPGAQKAAEAARCAGDQGKYWQYHDSLFQNQQSIF